MEVYLQVRRAYFDDGRSKRSSARDFGLARGTVDKMCAFPLPPEYRRQKDVRRPKLDGFTDFGETVVVLGGIQQKDHFFVLICGTAMLAISAPITEPYRRPGWTGMFTPGLLRFVYSE